MKEPDRSTTRWQLKRQDDHGNRYIIATFESKEQASKVMTDYESKGHKQTYWIEEVSEPLSSQQ